MINDESSSVNAVGYYLGYEAGLIVGKGYIHGPTHGLSFGSYSTIRGIDETDFFLSVFTASFNLLDVGNKLGIVDGGTIAGDGKLDYMLVNDQVIPSPELNQQFVNFIQKINPEEGVWIIGGGSGDKLSTEEAFRGWYKILQFNDPYKPPKKCHDDCATCVEIYTIDPHNCLTCADNTKILGVSGCKCSPNCLSCSENNNPQKCKSCSKGYFLQDGDDDGVGECIEGEVAFDTCTGEKNDLASDKVNLQGNLDTCTTEKSTLTNEKKPLKIRLSN